MLLPFIVKIVLSFSCEKNENKQKEAGFGPFSKHFFFKASANHFCPFWITQMSHTDKSRKGIPYKVAAPHSFSQKVVIIFRWDFNISRKDEMKQNKIC